MSSNGQLSGTNAKFQISEGFGTSDHNVIGSAFAAGSTLGGPVTIGESLTYNNDGHCLVYIPRIRDTLTESAHVNLFNHGTHSVYANAFASQNTLANHLKYDRNGAGMNWSHINGHSANATISHIPSFDTHTVDANAFASQNTLANDLKYDRNVAGMNWSHINGHSANATISHIPSFDTHTVDANAFASQHTLANDLKYDRNGARMNWSHINGHSASASAAISHIPSFDTHTVDANAFASQNTLANYLKFDRNGAGMNWSHINGHNASASAAISHIPSYGTQAELGGSGSWKSQNGSTSLDVSGSASKWMSGPYQGQTNYDVGMGLKHKF